MAKKTIRTCQLETPFENDTQFSWQDYPRPQLKRDSYLSLCGSWQLSVKKYAVAISSMAAGRQTNCTSICMRRMLW